MADPIVLDYNLMMASSLGGRGIDPERFAAAAARFPAVHEEVANWRQRGDLGFFSLTDREGVLEQILRFAHDAGESFDNIVVLGIGGSALGATTLREALLPPAWNELDDVLRGNRPRLYILDNIDPTTIAPLLERLDLRRTLFNVISKSGATAETMAQFLIIRDRLDRAFDGDDCRGNLIFTTDPANGVLRQLAHNEGIATLPIPPNVGGRFSIFSAVGLLPAALVGIDIAALLAGAREIDERCRTEALQENPAGLFATLQFLADTELDARIHVMMPYSDRLAAAADWFRQLWAESLGKQQDRAGNEVFRGPTPVKALGATDQHSQTQLYMEGPFDKTITFLTVGEHPGDLVIPQLYPETDTLAYLGGHTLGALLDAEQRATARALARRGRMNMTIELPTLSAHTLGQLLMMLQIATSYAGALYQVDPLNQPGVELGKELTYALMGRPGYDAPRGADTGSALDLSLMSPARGSASIPQGTEPASTWHGQEDKRYEVTPFARAERVNIGALTVSSAHVQANRYNLLRSVVDGLAHEIKNPIHAAVINLELLRRRSQQPDPEWILERVEVLEYEIARVHDLVDGLFRLVRQSQTTVEWIDLDELVDSLLPTLRAYGKVARVEIEYRPTGNAFVAMNRAAAQQVLLNLIVNSVEAMRPAGGQIELWGTLEEDEIHIRIQDTRRGVSAEIFPRPEESESMIGTADAGGGLVVARWLMEEAGGRMEIVDPGGNGTGACFLIAFGRRAGI